MLEGLGNWEPGKVKGVGGTGRLGRLVVRRRLRGLGRCRVLERLGGAW